MNFYNDFTVKFLDKINFPQEAKEFFWALEKKIDGDKKFRKEYEKIVDEYMEPCAHDLGQRLEDLDKLASKMDESRFSLHMCFLITCAETLLLRYYERGIPEEIFWRSMDDLRCKLLECKECKGVWGTFVGGWFNRFYELTRFGLGRFQFELNTYSGETRHLKGGFTVKEDDLIVGFHIPSSGISLTDEVRYDSYRRAFNFYKDAFGGGPVLFECGSWLLYSGNKEILPPTSNVLRFIDDFEIIRSRDKDEFGDAWRVFGKYADLPPVELPRDTTMRKCFADRLIAGKKTGDAYGIIVFDGEKILNK